MDPNATLANATLANTLANIRRLSATVLSYDSPTVAGFHAAQDLADSVGDLHEWLTEGGFLPACVYCAAGAVVGADRLAAHIDDCAHRPGGALDPQRDEGAAR